MDRQRHAVPKQEMGPEPRDVLRIDAESFFESLDLLFAALAIGVVIGCAVQTFPIVIAKFELVEPILLSSSDRVFAHEQFAVSGSWPSAERQSTERASTPERISALTRSVAFNEGGRLDYALDLRGMPTGVLSFRPFVGPADSPTSIVWLCADAVAPAEFRASSVDGTTIDAAFLPAPCRDTWNRR